MKGNWHLFGLCWLTYVITYLCRVNFSSVMDKLSGSIQASAAQMGLIGSCFFFSYAIGQMINGRLGDRISPFRFIAFAITGTGLLNIAMSVTTSYNALLIIWSCNGYIQSMLWGPMMRILSERFGAGDRIRISTGMSTSMVIGFLVSWAIFGKGFQPLSWQWYFMVPAIMSLTVSAFWIRPALQSKSMAVLKNQSANACQKPMKSPLGQVFFRERIWLIALSCFCLGAIKESVSLWAPLLMTKMLRMDLNTSFLLISIIPFANFGGILASGRLISKYHGRVRESLLTLFSTAIACTALLWLIYERHAVIAVLLIAVISGTMYGCNTILLSFIPISFTSRHLVSTLVGIFDFMSYMGAAVSSMLLGTLVSSQRYYCIFLFWLLAAGCANAFVWNFRQNGCGNSEETEPAS